MKPFLLSGRRDQFGGAGICWIIGGRAGTLCRFCTSIPRAPLWC